VERGRLNDRTPRSSLTERQRASVLIPKFA
jgi:hypothetical protein